MFLTNEVDLQFRKGMSAQTQANKTNKIIGRVLQKVLSLHVTVPLTANASMTQGLHGHKAKL